MRKRFSCLLSDSHLSLLRIERFFEISRTVLIKSFTHPEMWHICLSSSPASRERTNDQYRRISRSRQRWEILAVSHHSPRWRLRLWSWMVFITGYEWVKEVISASDYHVNTLVNKIVITVSYHWCFISSVVFSAHFLSPFSSLPSHLVWHGFSLYLCFAVPPLPS